MRVRGEADLVLRVAQSYGTVVSDLTRLSFGARDGAALDGALSRDDEFTATAALWEEPQLTRPQGLCRVTRAGPEKGTSALFMGIVASSCGEKLPRRKHAEPAYIVNHADDGWNRQFKVWSYLRFESSRGSSSPANARPKELPPLSASISLRRIASRAAALLSQQCALGSRMMRIQASLSLNALAHADTVLGRGCGKCLRAAATRRLREALETWDGNYDANRPAPMLRTLCFSIWRGNHIAPRKLYAYRSRLGNARPDMGRHHGPSTAAIRLPRYAAPHERPTGISSGTILFVFGDGKRALDHLSDGSVLGRLSFADLPAYGPHPKA